MKPKQPPTLNEDIIRQSKLAIPMFSKALKIALAEHDNEQLRKLAAIAARQYANLSGYIDQCDPTVDLDPTVLVIMDYWRDNAEDIEKALKREPEDDDPSEAWKKTG